jgi:DNA-nicking Smr family endonuclease
MDFGEILNEWDRIKRVRGEDRKSPAEDGRGRDLPEDPRSRGAEESRRLMELRPQAALDLHGMTARQAEDAIAAFLRDAARRGLEKVLIVHGKGNHSGGAGVLRAVARRALESSQLAGRFGPAARADGGTGATWVLVRRPAT